MQSLHENLEMKRKVTVRNIFTLLNQPTKTSIIFQQRLGTKSNDMKLLFIHKHYVISSMISRKKENLSA